MHMVHRHEDDFPNEEHYSMLTAANQPSQRIDSLRIDSQRQWGKMSVAQAIAHCSSGLEMAMGEIKPPRALIGRLLGSVIKPVVVGNDEEPSRSAYCR